MMDNIRWGTRKSNGERVHHGRMSELFAQQAATDRLMAASRLGVTVHVLDEMLASPERSYWWTNRKNGRTVVVPDDDVIADLPEGNVIPIGVPGWDTEENLQARLAAAEGRATEIEVERKKYVDEECSLGEHRWETSSGNTWGELGEEMTCRWCKRVGTIMVVIHGRP